MINPSLACYLSSESGQKHFWSFLTIYLEVNKIYSLALFKEDKQTWQKIFIHIAWHTLSSLPVVQHVFHTLTKKSLLLAGVEVQIPSRWQHWIAIKTLCHSQQTEKYKRLRLTHTTLFLRLTAMQFTKLHSWNTIVPRRCVLQKEKKKERKTSKLLLQAFRLPSAWFQQRCFTLTWVITSFPSSLRSLYPPLATAKGFEIQWGCISAHGMVKSHIWHSLC